MDATANLSDDQIRQTLLFHGRSNIPPIGPSTRPVLLRWIAQLTSKDKNHLAAESAGNTNDEEELPVPTSSSSHSATPDHVTSQNTLNETGFYVLTLNSIHDSSTPADEKNMEQRIYTSRADAMKAVKEVMGARFKKFSTKDDAQRFVEERRVDSVCMDNNVDNVIAEKKVNAFPSVKVPDLSSFRKLIESGNIEKFVEMAWKNPHYLINTQKDAPEILKPSGRYNALHCAVIYGSLVICKKLMEILEDDNYWRLVYPNDSVEVRTKRRNHLIDLYLNTREKGNHETSLHLACKFGHEEIVSYLLTFPTLSTTGQNKYGQTVCDVINTSSQAKKQRILELVTAPPVYFVPVLRADDNTIHPRLSTPCTLQQLEATKSPLETAIISSAIAGPMSPSQAKTFYMEWRSPGKVVERRAAQNVKRSDPDRGMERVGRRLAHQWKVEWKERWEFLKCSCDLSKPDGLETLENYLKKLKSSESNNHSVDGECMLSSDRLLSTLEMSPTQVKENVGILDTSLETDVILADMMASLHTSAGFITPKLKKCSDREQIFLTGSEPTKLDYDVCNALEGCVLNGSAYPNIVCWHALVSSYSEEEQRRWHTPCKRAHTPQLQPSESPLLQFRESPFRHKVPPVKLFATAQYY